jgi:hypothetical protein
MFEVESLLDLFIQHSILAVFLCAAETGGGGKHNLPPGWGSAIDPETGAEYFFEWGKGKLIKILLS